MVVAYLHGVWACDLPYAGHHVMMLLSIIQQSYSFSGDARYVWLDRCGTSGYPYLDVSYHLPPRSTTALLPLSPLFATITRRRCRRHGLAWTYSLLDLPQRSTYTHHAPLRFAATCRSSLINNIIKQALTERIDVLRGDTQPREHKHAFLRARQRCWASHATQP